MQNESAGNRRFISFVLWIAGSKAVVLLMFYDSEGAFKAQLL